MTNNSPAPILIVEDVPNVLELLEVTLRFKGYSVITAHNGEEALDVIEKTRPVLIITDILMPVLSGLELCKILKNQLVTSHIPILVLSAKTNISLQIEGLEMGADVYMVKPFNIDPERFGIYFGARTPGYRHSDSRRRHGRGKEAPLPEV